MSLAAAAAALLSLTWGATARAEVAMHVMARGAATTMLTDGDRWAAFEPMRGTTRIIDAQSGRTAQRPDPAGCEGGLVAVGGGELLYRCDLPQCPDGATRLSADSCFYPTPTPAGRPPTSPYSAATRYVVEDAATGQVRPMAGAERLPAGGSEVAFTSAEHIGARWVEGVSGGYHSTGIFFVDWRTGRVVVPDPRGGPYAVDLDQPEVLAQQCPGLTGAQSPIQQQEFVGTLFFPLRFDAPFALTTDPRSLKPVLARCGSGRRVTLHGSSPDLYRPTGTVQVAGGVALWAVELPSGAWRIYATRLDTRRAQWHRAVSSVRGPGQGTLAHTSTRLYDSVGESYDRFTIYAAKLTAPARTRT
ncbi:MAG TPA: hypothetical protein VGM33_15245 [Baekduia sp.]